MTQLEYRRCSWAGDDPAYQNYHDQEWGVPVFDDVRLFEMLILEGAQAGLSWITILNKRANYRAAFDGFDPTRIARYDGARVESLLRDTGIVRNRLKVESTISNARAYLALVENGPGFAPFLWQFVEGRPIRNRWRVSGEVPSTTPISDAMSRDLKKRGFRFVGSTICYAFMQAVGMVNDHLTTCYRWEECNRLPPP